jgi:hypothetical protein
MLAAVTGTADDVRRNRAAWDRLAAEYAEPGLRMWAEPEPTWGIWNVAEMRAGVLPADLEGQEFISVHASVFDPRRLVEALGPKRVVPIHSDAGDRFCEFFPRVECHADGDWWQVGSK